MCGIAGYIHLDVSKAASAYIVKAMTDTLAHRGPDDSGLLVSGRVGLGHRRLSIIDLKTGRQPISNEDGSVTIVYNGEIYNFQELKDTLIEKGHRFKTHSDTEVIVHSYEEYGEDCVRRFNGMFAFAIWDSRSDRLFLARDRFGKKPLYYAAIDNQFIFASELKAVLKHPSTSRQIDMAALAKYLAYEYVPAPLSIFKDIRKLEPASRISIKGSDIRIDAYWDMKFEEDRGLDPNQACERVGELLKRSVKRRLVSDVPLGVFLSGGIDSSAVVAMMTRLMSPKDIKTFSIGFKERSYDESSDARRVADYFGTDHHEETLEPDKMLEVLPNILNILDEPFADSSIIPTYLVSRFTRKYVTVALGGDGGDELFLGYPSFLAHKINSCLDMLPAGIKKIPLKILAGLIPITTGYMSLNFKAARFLRGMEFPEEARHQVWLGSFTPQDEKRLFLPIEGLDLSASSVYDISERFFRKASGLDRLSKASYIYIKTYMADDILAKVDRASMANSLEVRAPFLDIELAEFAATIPSGFKLKGLTSKWILKKALKDSLPGQTLAKAKKGFAVPVAKWLMEDLKGLLLDTFRKSKIEKEGIFDYNYINNLIGDYLKQRRDLRKEIWALFMFEMWYDRWMK